MGRVTSNTVRAKPAREVHIGDQLRIQKEDGEHEIEVLGLKNELKPSPWAPPLPTTQAS